MPNTFNFLSMKRGVMTIFSLVLFVMLLSFMTACGTSTTTVTPVSTTIITTAEGVISDIQAVLAGLGSTNNAAVVGGEVLSGLESVLNAIQAGSTVEANVISTTTAAIKSAMADDPSNSTLQSDGNKALNALDLLSSTASETLEQQAFTLAGAFLVSYLQDNTTSVSRYKISVIQQKIDDANTKLNSLKTN